MAKSFLTALQVAKLAADPQIGKTGQVYFNTTLNKFRGYNNTTWSDLGSGSGGGSGGIAQLFVDYTGSSIVNNQYFVVGTSNHLPNNPLVGDMWIVTDDAANIPYFLYQGTTAPDATQYQFWADPSDYGGDLFYRNSTAPTQPYVGQYWVSPDLATNNDITVSNASPDPQLYEFWADPTDTQNLAQYAQIYNTKDDFPSATSNPGLIVVEQQYGKAYYAYNGSWIGLTALSDANSLLYSLNQTAEYTYIVDTEQEANNALLWMGSGLF